MNSRIFIILVFYLLIFSGTGVLRAQSAKPLDAIYDPSKNETTIYLSTKYMPIATYQTEAFVPPSTGEWISRREGLTMAVFFTSPGNNPSEPELITIKFESTASGRLRYDRDRALSVTADGEKFDLGQTELTKSARDNASRGMRGTYYEESLETAVKLADYSRIVNAKKVEMTLGETKFRLSKRDLKTLRSYFERLKS